MSSPYLTKKLQPEQQTKSVLRYFIDQFYSYLNL